MPRCQQERVTGQIGELTTNASRTAGDIRPAAITAALAGLTVLAGVTLQGRIPGVTPAPREETPESPLAFAATLALLAGAIVIMLVSLVAAARRPARRGRPGGRELPPGVAGGPFRLRWRAVLVVAAVLGTVAVLVGLLGRVAVEPPVQQPPVGTEAPSGAAQNQPGEPPPASRATGRDMGPYLAVTAVALILMAAVGTVLARRRDPETGLDAPGSPADPEPSPAPPLAVAAERGLAAVEDPRRRPREAIIACYAAMEKALAGTEAAPLASDTPTEVLARAVQSRALRPESAEPLVELFAEARFSSHVMTESHRTVAEQALRRVLDDVGARS